MGAQRIPPDREIVVRFVEHLRTKGFPELKIDSWPEDERPGQSVVEAIAGPFAIEHTSIDTLPDQRRIGEQFMDALGILDRLSATARLTIIVPYDLVSVGSDWEAYRLALASWIIEVSPALPDGRHEIEMPDTSLRCIGRKDSTGTPGVFIARPVQEDGTLAQRIGHQIARKMKKLRPYKTDGHTTVLLLETPDQSLMNQHKMLEAVRDGVGGAMPVGLDQIWFTEARGAFFFDFTKPIKCGSNILD